MAEIDPTDTGFWKWSWAKAKAHRSRFWASGVIFAAIAVGAARYVPRRWGTTFEIGLVAFGMAVVGTSILALAVAVVLTPYEQRNVLHAKLKDANLAVGTLTLAAAQEHVSDPHFRELKTIAEDIYALVANNRPFTGDDKDREALTAHFPHLNEQLAQWDAAIQRVYDRSEILEWYLWDEIGTRGLKEPRFEAESLRLALLRKIMAAADLASPFPRLQWTHRSGGAHLDSGSAILVKLSPVESESVDEFRDIVQPIDELWADSENWSVTKDYADRDQNSGWPLLKDPLLRALDVVCRRDYFLEGAGCERCKDYSVVEIGSDGL